jgi:hypothetical protein
MSPQKINQVLAIEKGVKNRVTSNVTKLYHACQREGLFDGFTKVYRARDADGEQFPPERKEVQHRTDQVAKDLQQQLAELFDVTATKDWANCRAAADVSVDGVVLLAAVPVTYLLFLEKQLDYLGSVIDALPTLDTSVRWQRDDNQGVFVSDPLTSHKTKKVQKPIVLYDATPEHPAQTQLITEDVIIGHWDQTRFSGAMPVPAKQALQERLLKLLRAVKQAREAANAAEAEPRTVGAALLGYIFNE